MQEITRIDWLKMTLQEAGQEALESVGPGRGASAKTLYSAALSQLLNKRLIEWDSPWVIVRDWPVSIQVSEGKKVDDSSFPVAVVLFIGEAPDFPEALKEDPILYRDFAEIEGLSTDDFAPMLVVDINCGTGSKAFKPADQKKLLSRAATSKVGLAAALNFGLQELRSFFPEGYWAAPHDQDAAQKIDMGDISYEDMPHVGLGGSDDDD